MELREYREGDLDALTRLGVAAFGASVSDWEEHFLPDKNPRLDPERVYVIEDDGEVRASTTVLPLESFVDGESHPMGGIAAVMAHPAYRRRGYAGELMRAVLRGMRESGTHLSMLWPFAHAFYRAYGWELAGEAIEYGLKPADLSTSPEQRNLRGYRDGDLPRLMELFEREAGRYPFCVRRIEGSWRKLLSGKGTIPRGGREAAVYDREGRIEGYLLYKMSGWNDDREPRRTLSVSELVADNPRAREGLLSFMAAQDPQVFGIEYSTPRGEPLHPYLRSSHVKAKIEPEFMVRLVDVEGALGFLDRTVESPLLLEVADDVIPENAGEYTVGSGEVVRGAEVEERVSLDVRRLAQLYAGYLPARQLARYGFVKASSPHALDLLESLFPVGDPWVFPLDHF